MDFQFTAVDILLLGKQVTLHVYCLLISYEVLVFLFGLQQYPSTSCFTASDSDTAPLNATCFDKGLATPTY